jgi:hypothetical protein
VPNVGKHEELLAEYDLEKITWTDATSIGHWTDLDDVPEFAEDHGFVVTNVGYRVFEDDECVVLAARITLGAEPQQVGIFERLPKGMIVKREVVVSGRPAVRGDGDGSPVRRDHGPLRRLWRRAYCDRR